MVETRLEIHHLNVDVGDGTVIAIFQRNDARDNWAIVDNILIDSGYHRDERISTYMTDLNLFIKKPDGTPVIKYVITTHYHDDHHSGYATFFPSGTPSVSPCEVQHVIDVGGYSPRSDTGIKLNFQTPFPLYAKIWGDAAKDPFSDSDKFFAKGAPLANVPQPIITLAGGIELRCYAGCGYVWNPERRKKKTDPRPTKGTVTATYSEPITNPNASSMAFLLEWGGFSYLTSGDLTGDQAKEVANACVEHIGGAVTIVKANHHGSADNNPEEAYSKLKPKAVIIPCAQARWRIPNGDGIDSISNGAGAIPICLANTYFDSAFYEATDPAHVFYSTRTNCTQDAASHWKAGYKSVAVVVADTLQIAKQRVEGLKTSKKELNGKEEEKYWILYNILVDDGKPEFKKFTVEAIEGLPAYAFLNKKAFDDFLAGVLPEDPDHKSEEAKALMSLFSLDPTTGLLEPNVSKYIEIKTEVWKSVSEKLTEASRLYFLNKLVDNNNVMLSPTVKDQTLEGLLNKRKSRVTFNATSPDVEQYIKNKVKTLPEVTEGGVKIRILESTQELDRFVITEKFPERILQMKKARKRSARADYTFYVSGNKEKS